MEKLLGLVDWRETLAGVGYAQYFEDFFDNLPYEGEPYANGAMTETESDALRTVHRLMIDALNATPKVMSQERFMATGWPQRIEPAAEKALRLMVSRGRFSEEREETDPSREDGWPWREGFSRKA